MVGCGQKNTLYSAFNLYKGVRLCYIFIVNKRDLLILKVKFPFNKDFENMVIPGASSK